MRKTSKVAMGVVALVAFLVSTVFASVIFRTETTATGTTALDYTATYTSRARVKGVFIKAAAPITETVTLTFASKTNSTYNTVLATQSLINASNYYFTPDNDLILDTDDGLRVQCTKATANTTIYATIESESY